MTARRPAGQRTLLFVHPSDELYGIDVVLLNLIDGLDQARYRPIVVLPTDVPYCGLLSAALRERDIPTFHLETAILRRAYFTPLGMLRYLWRLLASTVQLAGIIRAEGVDIVHNNSLAVLPGALAGRLTGTPCVWQVHEIITKPRFLWKTTAWLAPRLAGAVVAVSGAVRAHLCEGSTLNQRKAVVIYNGIDVGSFPEDPERRDQIRAEWGVSGGEVVVGMVGRFNSWKGQELFVRVAHRIAATNPEVKFALIGGTVPGQEHFLDGIRALVAELALGERVIINDFRTDIPQVLSALDVFVLPSILPDPFPTVVLEAMAAGKPVVANAHGGCVEMIEDASSGFLVPGNDPELMASIIRRLVGDRDLRLAVGRNARQRVAEKFSSASFSSAWMAQYDAVARSGALASKGDGR